ncbi:MAG: hypothetical protein K1X79_02845 [Oligoflexia bacterium]|nr:hypothetical protein [Oligoflexia bacterium]
MIPLMRISWRREILKYLEAARISFRSRAAYPITLLSRLLTIGLRIWIFYAVYSATYRSVGGDQIGGLSLAQLLWVLALTQSFQASMRPPSISTIVEEEIRSGEFAYTVCRPFSYVIYHLASHIGRSLPTLFVNVCGVCAVCLVLVGPISVSTSSVGLGLLCLCLGIIIDFLLTFSIGLSALWIEDTFGAFILYQKTQLVLGGQILPLTMFPGLMRSIAERLPFAVSFYSAAHLLVDFDYPLFWSVIGVQVFWILAGALIAQTCFRRGMRSVSINGG